MNQHMGGKKTRVRFNTDEMKSFVLVLTKASRNDEKISKIR